MPKSKIIKDVVNDTVPLDISLTRLMILAKDVHNSKLASWAEKELTGYAEDDEIPAYRKVRCPKFRYSGINGNFQVTHSPLPLSFIGEDFLERIVEVNIYNDIKSIKKFAESMNTITRDHTALAGNISNATGGEVICTSIEQVLPQSIFDGIYSKVKNMLINALYGLEKEYGDLDVLGIDIDDERKVAAANSKLNETVFNIQTPAIKIEDKDPWYSKVAWNIIIPIITAIVGAVLSALIINR